MAQRNLRIVHHGMGWPRGTVVEPHCLAKDGAEHLKIGAVEWTTAAATVTTALPKSKPASDTSALVENEKLRGQIVNLEKDIARLQTENDRLSLELEKATADLDAQEKLAAEQIKLAMEREHDLRQKLNQA